MRSSFCWSKMHLFNRGLCCLFLVAVLESMVRGWVFWRWPVGTVLSLLTVSEQQCWTLALVTQVYLSQRKRPIQVLPRHGPSQRVLVDSWSSHGTWSIPISQLSLSVTLFHVAIRICSPKASLWCHWLLLGAPWRGGKKGCCVSQHGLMTLSFVSAWNPWDMRAP